MAGKEWVLKNVEEICADTRDTDEVCMALEHSTIFATAMIENLTKIILDLQQELSKSNEKLKKIEEYIYGHKLFWMRYGKTLYRESLIKILSIIKGDE